MAERSTLPLSLVVDMYGCPNRCLHCWLGHMPNRRMPEGSDEFIVGCFEPYFGKIAYYSWAREPDFCDDYRARWEKDIALSKNIKPERFELASFWRIVRDPEYIPFLRSVGVKKVQLTLFGLRETQDRYVGRKNAFDEVMKATDLLIEGGIIPRWQCFINEENREEILEIRRLALEKREKDCPELEFFVHEGSCDGENRRLYPIRIRKDRIPEELIPDYFGYNDLKTERELVEKLRSDGSSPVFSYGDELTLYISNGFDVFYNYSHMTKPWAIGNLKSDDPGEIVRRAINGDTYALNAAKECVWARLVKEFGDPDSERAFSEDDYKEYIFNLYLDKKALAEGVL